MSNSPLHVVFGAGQVGTLLAGELLAKGFRVHQVRRGTKGPERPGLTWISGDASDPAVTERACSGASVLYDCMTPAYDQWHRYMPACSAACCTGARTSGAGSSCWTISTCTAAGRAALRRVDAGRARQPQGGAARPALARAHERPFPRRHAGRHRSGERLLRPGATANGHARRPASIGGCSGPRRPAAGRRSRPAPLLLVHAGRRTRLAVLGTRDERSARCGICPSLPQRAQERSWSGSRAPSRGQSG